MLFHKSSKVGVWVPVLAEVCSKLMSWTMFGIQFFLDAIKGLGAKDKIQRRIHFLASPLGREHTFFSLLRCKVKYRARVGGA